MKEEYFIIGNSKVPGWVQNELKNGKIMKSYNEENDVNITKVITPTKEYILNDGDAIVKTKNGLVGLKKEVFNKMFNKTEQKEENKDDNE